MKSMFPAIAVILLITNGVTVYMWKFHDGGHRHVDSGPSAEMPADHSEAFSIFGEKTSASALMADSKAQFFDLEKKKYELIKNIARERYLEAYWKKEAGSGDVEKFRKEFLDKKIKVADGEIDEAMKRFEKQLERFPEKERRQKIVEYLKGSQEQKAVEDIVGEGVKSKSLVYMYPKPVEPRYEMKIEPTDAVRYGPDPTNTGPQGCEGDDCPITIVEFTEFQCPFCARAQATNQKLLEEYKGKIRWVLKDLPLSFHDRAKPAAVAARCAGDQGKYWSMYKVLFDNQRKLSDADLKAHAETAGVDMGKWEECVKNPGDKVAMIDANAAAASTVGISGTPGFLVNGVRLSGAQPFGAFAEVIDAELEKLQ